MSNRLPLPTLLSHALVAFTIEFDNESDHRIPHWTTEGGRPADALRGVWLVSMVMWLNCMQFVGEERITVREIERLARTKTNWRGMQRWRYIRVEPDPNDPRPKPPPGEWFVRATSGGRKAQEIWRPLLGEIEDRWRERFGKGEIGRLRESLWAVVRQFPFELPDCMPILGYGMRCVDRVDILPASEKREDASAADLALPVLLSRVLLAFAIDFERESLMSLAICANLLRVLDEDGVRLRDLARMAGVSKEALAMAMGILRKARLAIVAAEKSGSRTRVVRLTALGRAAQDLYRQMLPAIEKDWRSRYGAKTIDHLSASLELLVADGTAKSSPLFGGLEPYPDGWRAARPKPDTLPHFPMVLHRGGYPDGS
jgi:DNA-binding MarR family transcriptional regulator